MIATSTWCRVIDNSADQPPAATVQFLPRRRGLR
jgi:hypothetical protein